MTDDAAARARIEAALRAVPLTHEPWCQGLRERPCDCHVTGRPDYEAMVAAVAALESHAEDGVKLPRHPSAEWRDGYRAGMREARPQPFTKNHCDLCQEPLETKRWAKWVEEGWSLACDDCWQLLAQRITAAPDFTSGGSEPAPAAAKPRDIDAAALGEAPAGAHALNGVDAAVRTCQLTYEAYCSVHHLSATWCDLGVEAAVSRASGERAPESALSHCGQPEHGNDCMLPSRAPESASEASAARRLPFCDVCEHETCREYRNTVREVIDARLELDRLRAALAEIAKGEGAFSRDPLTHAGNTIDNMKALARAALAASPPPPAESRPAGEAGATGNAP